MEVSVFRIDDRLIHGQVITAWIAYADAKSIVVADDKAAKDEFTQSLLKMATPDSIQLKILSVEDAITYLKGDEDAGKSIVTCQRTGTGTADYSRRNRKKRYQCWKHEYEKRKDQGAQQSVGISGGCGKYSETI